MPQGYAKVDDFRPRLAEDHVSELAVPVDDACGVDCRQSLAQSAQHLRGHRAVSGNMLGKGQAFGLLGGQERIR